MDRKKLLISILTLIILLFIANIIYIKVLDKEKNNEEPKTNENTSKKEEENPPFKPEIPKEPEPTPPEEEKLEIVKEINKEINSSLLKIEELFNKPIEENYTIKYYSNNKEIEFTKTYNKLGTYLIQVTINNEEYTSTLNVKDTTKPVLTLKQVTITEGSKYELKNFVSSCKDNSNKSCTLSFKDSTKKTKPGEYEITIIAKDPSNNTTTKSTKLIIKAKPKFVEAKKEVTTKKSNYKYGIKIIETITTTYDLYSDGSKKNVKTSSTKTYDYSTFNATTKEMLAEATTNRKTYASQVNEILKYTNEYRSEANLKKVVLDEELTKAAMVRAIEMAYTNKPGHTRPNGDRCFTVLQDINYKYQYAGENVAKGINSAEDVVKLGWRNSEQHYETMINPVYTKIGIGIMKYNNTYYWVQIFT